MIRWLNVDKYYETAVPPGFTLAIYQPGGYGAWNFSLHTDEGELAHWGTARSRDNARRLAMAFYQHEMSEARLP